MALHERIKSLADAKGISLPALEAELGFGNSTIVKWKKSIPNADKLNAVAQYFNVTMDYLLNGNDDDVLTQKDNRDISKDLDAIMNKIEAGEDSPLYYNGEEVDKESMELLRDAISMSLRHLKIINKEKYNPRKNKKAGD